MLAAAGQRGKETKRQPVAAVRPIRRHMLTVGRALPENNRQGAAECGCTWGAQPVHNYVYPRIALRTPHGTLNLVGRTPLSG
ncbi:hypothetical protein NDU88_002139 [Pleurodeles waltl]|uniref:Uncharacterized protein n=1 Tax=Pleurodeles waltl TaxID=8319 RepID=A0AAV7T2C7_PLEWA|nr:hypothetical protein NDU88_002139 [Pleurodeles waltl]